MMPSQMTCLDFSQQAEEIEAELQKLGFSANHMPLGAKTPSTYFKALNKFMRVSITAVNEAAKNKHPTISADANRDNRV